MSNAMVLSNGFVELNNDEMLYVDGGSWNTLGKALVITGAAVTIAAAPWTVGVMIAVGTTKATAIGTGATILGTGIGHFSKAL